MENVNAEFVDRLVRRRKTVGVSQLGHTRAMAAAGFAFHGMTMARIESCERPVRLAEAVALANIVGATLPELLPDTAPACTRCLGKPPVGFTCNACRASGAVA